MKRGPLDKSLIFSIAFVLATVLSVPAQGNPPQSDNGTARCTEQSAGKHFVEGTSLAQHGDHPAAIVAFTAAYHCKAHPAALYNIAQSYVQMANYALALSYLQRYVTEYEGVIDAKHEQEVKEQMRQLTIASADEHANEGSASFELTPSEAPGEEANTASMQSEGDVRFANPGAAPDAGRSLGEISAPTIESNQSPTVRAFGADAVGRAKSALVQTTFPQGTALRAGEESGLPRILSTVLTGAGLLAGGAAVGVLVSNQDRNSEWKRVDSELARARLLTLTADQAQELNARQLDNNRRAQAIQTHNILTVVLGGSAVAALLGAAYVELSTETGARAGVVLEGNHLSVWGHW